MLLRAGLVTQAEPRLASKRSARVGGRAQSRRTGRRGYRLQTWTARRQRRQALRLLSPPRASWCRHAGILKCTAGHGESVSTGVRRHVDDNVREEILYGRDHDHLRIFISSRMNKTLDAERKAAAEAVDRVSGHKAWWWEHDAPMGVLHSEKECIGFAKTSAALILLVAGELSAIVHSEYSAARDGGADRYILIRETDELPPEVDQFIKEQRAEVVTRSFRNVDELQTHIHQALTRSVVRAVAHRVLERRTHLGVSDG